MQKKDKNSEFFYFYFLNMSKKNLTVLFLLLSGVIAVLAYAGGKQSNWLSDSQINFAKDNLSTDRGNKLEAQLRDAVINGLTTRAQNHEKRLQAFAQSTGYPNLTPEQTSFSDLLSTKHSNQLTADMRNGLLTRLTYAVTNHEMRLRALEKPTATPTKVDGKCGTAAATCLAGTVKLDNGQTACGTTRTWHCEGSNGWSTAYNCPFQNPACKYSCNGTYKSSHWSRIPKKIDNIVCFTKQSNTKNHNTNSAIWIQSGPRACEGEEANGQWWIFDPTNGWEGPNFSCAYSPSDQIGDLPTKPEYCTPACKYTPRYWNVRMEDYCTKVYREESCSSLSESACKAQSGCRWEKK